MQKQQNEREEERKNQKIPESEANERTKKIIYSGNGVILIMK